MDLPAPVAPSTRQAQILQALSGRGVMTADHLESRRLWLTAGEWRVSLGSVICLEGAGALTRVLGFLAEHPRLRVLWVEQNAQAYPPGMAQRDVGFLARTLFCDAGGDSEKVQWTALQGMRSSLFQAVVLRLDEALSRRPAELQGRLRRLRLEAERAQAIVWVIVTPGAQMLASRTW